MPPHGAGPGSTDDEALRRRVEEALEAARRAQAAAERAGEEAARRAAEASQPGRFEEMVRAISALLSALVDVLQGRIRAEIDHARRSGEEFVARILRGMGRSAGLMVDALLFSVLAVFLAIIAAVVMVFAANTYLNQRLGAPWGTAATGAIFLALALLSRGVAKWKMGRVVREAEDIAPWLRDR